MVRVLETPDRYLMAVELVVTLLAMERTKFFGGWKGGFCSSLPQRAVTVTVEPRSLGGGGYFSRFFLVCGGEGWQVLGLRCLSTAGQDERYGTGPVR